MVRIILGTLKLIKQVGVISLDPVMGATLPPTFFEEKLDA